MVKGQSKIHFFCNPPRLPRHALQAQGRGIGIGLLQDAIRRALLIAGQAGIPALLTHPIDEDAARFYKRFGFEASPLRQDQRLLLLKDARRWFHTPIEGR